MTQLSWIDAADGDWIETDSDNYDFTITPRGKGVTLRQFRYNTETLLSVIPCISFEAAKATAQAMEDLVLKQAAKKYELGKIRDDMNIKLPPAQGFYNDYYNPPPWSKRDG